MSSTKRISSGRQFFYTCEDFQWPSYHCSNNTTQNGLYLSKVINVKSNLNPSAVQSKKISELGLQTPLFTFLLICTVYKYANYYFNQLEQFLQAEYLRKYSSSRKLPDCQARQSLKIWSFEGIMSLKLLSMQGS